MATKTRHHHLTLSMFFVQLVILNGFNSSSGTTMPSSSLPLPSNLYQYSPMINQIMSKLYSTQVSFPQQQSNLASFEQVKRSQEDIQPSMHQLTNSVLTESATAGPTYEPSPEQNYTLMDSEYYQPSSVFSNYYLNPQYYPSMESSGNSYGLSPSVMEQYATMLQSNMSALNKHKANKQTGLGRRIGELVTNSAERASKAFKSFSQFKLFNDIKASRLLGLVSEQQPVDPKTINSSAVASPPSGGWYYPPSSNPWSSYIPPSASSIFYQQPVFVRTQEMATNSASPASSVGPINSLINPSSVSPGSPNLPLHGSKGSSEYMSSIPDFYPQKLPLDNSPMYQSVVNSQSNSQYNSGASSTSMPVGTSTTTVFHHFQGESNQNSGGNNQQSQDLFASPQTQYGLRVKPPKDFDFDGSSEDELPSSAEQDDTKMANGGSSGHNGGRNSMSNNDGPSNNEMGAHSSSSGQSPWSGGSSFDEYPEPGNGMEQDMFNSFSPNNRHRLNRPYIPAAPPRDNSERTPFRQVPNSRPYPSSVRRPMPLPEFDESDNWYNTFFGNNVKPISRFRGYPFNSSPLNFVPHHHPNANLLNSAASTPTSTALSPESFMTPFMNSPIRPDSASPNYFHFPSPARPSWPYGMYSHPVQSSTPYFGNFRPNPLMSAATSVRPVSMPFFPPTANYFMPRYPRTQALYGSYPTSFPANAYQTAPATMPGPSQTMMGASPYGMGRYPAMNPFSMMPASSSLYPVRVPYSPMVSMPPSMPFGMQAMGSTILPAIATHPVMRYRYGPDLTPSPTRRTINITKRAEIGSDMVEPNSNVLTKVSKAISNAFPLKTISRSSEENSKSNAIVPNREEQNLATLYNAYQVLHRRMENDQIEDGSKQAQPYYQYYIGKDTTTVASTTLPIDSSEQMDSSARTSVLNYTTVGRSIKARHVQDQLDEHEKKQEQIRRYLQVANETNTSSTTVQPSTPTTNKPITTTSRQAKTMSQLVAPTDEWRPLLRVGSARKRH